MNFRTLRFCTKERGILIDAKGNSWCLIRWFDLHFFTILQTQTFLQDMTQNFKYINWCDTFITLWNSTTVVIILIVCWKRNFLIAFCNYPLCALNLCCMGKSVSCSIYQFNSKMFMTKSKCISVLEYILTIFWCLIWNTTNLW